MNSKIAIVDYGLGNLFSVNQACEKVGLQPVITADAAVIAASDALILPGVGAFGDAMQNLEQNGLVDSLKTFAASGKPFLGICLGMQLLFSESEEFGAHTGLELVPGKVKRFPHAEANGETVKIPQIQWNKLYRNTQESWDRSALRALNEGVYMHFVHSYYVEPDEPELVLSYTEYGGIRYASSVMHGNITGMQFHPEKSGKDGLTIYETWANSIIKKS